MAYGPLVQAVLDANVIYPAFLRDVLLRLAAADLYLPYWSHRIHDEWTRNLLADRPELSPAKVSRTRAMMDVHFAGACVNGYEPFEIGLEAVAPEDRHVAAAARCVGADYIVTQNLKDFPPDALRPHGITAAHPDEFVCALIRADAKSVQRVLASHRNGLLRPPLTASEYAAAFVHAGLPRAGAILWP
ncbi:PIN domain-containing protein [Longimicrobium sp.]|uniref:PIN domain-containing protein n=1 Tax=Longimicrobium sp. TaxID=2029185 RepID=UPI002E2F17DB|nr:PIN domain-containing protein [Longimicrobium sp.]HEX6038823.1 PIN domain-containing protein [Longimicrobium sp.]